MSIFDIFSKANAEGLLVLECLERARQAYPSLTDAEIDEAFEEWLDNLHIIDESEEQ